MTPPLLTLTYTLSPADALAYESLPRELTGWRNTLFLAWLGLAGGAVAFVPETIAGPEWGWRFWLVGLALVAIAYAVARLVMRLAASRRARNRIPAAVDVTLEQWGDHLAATIGDRRLFIAYETIAAVATTSEHVFVTARPDVLIVPLRAFPDHAEMLAFGAHVDRLSHESAA